MSAETAFALACAVHAGFQVTVTVLAYPALAGQDEQAWAAAHERHSRAIAPLVAVLYAAVVATGVWLLVQGPGTAGWVAIGATSAALAVTALLAAPLHGRLTARDEALVVRLLLVDRWRCAGAVVGAVAAVVALG